MSGEIELVGIVAVAKNGIIGRDGEMPWHIPEDLRHFKAKTTDHPVIMGRVTYESIVSSLGGPLPERTTVVLTGGQLETPSTVRVANSITEAKALAAEAAAEIHGTDRVFVAGGATVYEQFFGELEGLIVTEVDERPAGDTTFPEWDRSAWREVSREAHDGFAFVEYERT